MPGLLLALATSYKVTPALFFIYFAYKRSWRTLTWGLLGLGIFLIIVPGVVIGPQFNGECLGMWWHRMITPFIVKNASSSQEMNQSLLAVLDATAHQPDSRPGALRYPCRRERRLVARVDGGLSVQGAWRCGMLGLAGVPVPDQDDATAATPACSAKSR